MNDSALLYPVLAMVLLTAIVALVLLARRIGEMKARRIRPQAVAASRDMASMLDDHRASDNFRNLFEAPVLFYVAMLAGITVHAASAWIVALAWLFVELRYAHSYVHCTYNRVMHRFKVYCASMPVLFAIWGTLAWRLLQAARA
ncbi:MAG: MAPEG family protein [Betaproteobacteria bacterium]